MATQDHESALSEILTLRDELAMYKAVTTPFEGKPRTNMTRVRRVPLNPHNVNSNSQNGAPMKQSVRSGLQHYVNENAEMTMDELDGR